MPPFELLGIKHSVLSLWNLKQYSKAEMKIGFGARDIHWISFWKMPDVWWIIETETVWQLQCDVLDYP